MEVHTVEEVGPPTASSTEVKIGDLVQRRAQVDDPVGLNVKPAVLNLVASVPVPVMKLLKAANVRGGGNQRGDWQNEKVT